jgi:hypothetical protein
MNDDTARGRFVLLSTVRLSGAILAALGLAVIAGRLDFMPREGGYAFFAVGLFEVLFLPAILARRWKSPPP